MTNRFALKQATHDFHQDLDSRISRLDLSRDEDYRAFLKLHARAVPPIECGLAHAGLSHWVAGWNKDGRSLHIAADLAAVGESMPRSSPAPEFDSIGAMLGAAYVLEGSRLGARVLRRQVGDGLPTDYLNDRSLDRWPEVAAAIEKHLNTDGRVSDAKDAARFCFGIFLDAAREAGL